MFFKKKKQNNTVFTHNCAMRIVCGRLEQVASMMALGNTLATTIDGAHKGAGMVKAQGEIALAQYYYEDQKWIQETYFAQRGLDKLGFTPDREVTEEDLENLSGDIEIEASQETLNIDFDEQHVEVDHYKDQKFEEL